MGVRHRIRAGVLVVALAGAAAVEVEVQVKADVPFVRALLRLVGVAVVMAVAAGLEA